MSNAVNVEIRETAKRSCVRLWQVAEEIGMSDAAYSRKLRHELTDIERKRVMEAISQVAAGKTEAS